MKELIMLTGMPGCGKSTFRAPYDAVTISSDDFIEAFARNNGITYNEAWKDCVKTAERAMYARLEQLIAKESSHIVWDQTNLTPASRIAKLNRFNQAGGKEYRKISIFFEPNYSLTLARNEQRREFGRALPISTLEDMSLQITRPTKVEGFDYVLVVPDYE